MFASANLNPQMAAKNQKSVLVPDKSLTLEQCSLRNLFDPKEMDVILNEILKLRLEAENSQLKQQKFEDELLKVRSNNDASNGVVSSQDSSSLQMVDLLCSKMSKGVDRGSFRGVLDVSIDILR